MASSSSKTISWAFYERTLTIEDLDSVIKLLERHRYSKASYHELGLRLKLSQNTLEKIKSDHGEVDPCFRECLVWWLRKADGVENPTINTLIAALRGIDNAAADGIKEERHETSTTDPTCHPDATIEQRAIHILHDESVNKKLLNLNGPCLIVRLLQKEGILNEESVTEVLGSDLLLKRYILFIQIHRAICKDHKSLLVFARLLCVTTGDENLGKEIEIQCSAADIKFDDKCITNPNEDPLPCLAKVETISIVLKNAESITEVKDIMSSLGLGDVITWYTFKNGKAVGSISPHLATFVIDAIEKSNIKELIESIEVGYYSYDQTRCNEACQKMERIIALEKELNRLKQELSDHQACFDKAYNRLLKLIDEFNKRNLDREKLKQELCNAIHDELYQNLVGMIKNELQDNFEDQFFDERTSYDEIYQKLVEKIDDFDKKSTELQSSKQELCRDIEKLEEKIDCLEKDKMDLKENKCSLEQKLGELQNNESYLKGQLEMKDKIIRVAIMEKEKMDDKMRNLKEQQQKEIKTFQDKILSLRLQLLQNQGGTASKETAIEKETTNQPVPIPQQQEYDPHTENISVSNSEITLTTPCLKTCKEIQIQDTVLSLSLHNAFADSASAILLRLQMTSIAYLYINRTRLSLDSVHSIVDVLQRLKALRLSNVYLPPTSLSYILNALLTNESLKEFTIQFEDQMMLPLSSTSAGFYAQAISNIIRSNSTLQYISILGLRLGEAGVVKILLALAKDNNTLRLLTLDLSHQATAYRFAEANGPIKDRLSFS